MMKERKKCMELVEMMVMMGKNRLFHLSEKEEEELFLSYLVDDRMEGKANEADGRN